MPESENSSSDNQDLLLEIGTWKLLIRLLLTIQTSWFLIYRGSAQVITIAITHRERVTQQSEDSTNSYYLVWSREDEVFQVKDDWRFLAWNNSD